MPKVEIPKLNSGETYYRNIIIEPVAACLNQQREIDIGGYLEDPQAFGTVSQFGAYLLTAYEGRCSELPADVLTAFNDFSFAIGQSKFYAKASLSTADQESAEKNMQVLLAGRIYESPETRDLELPWFRTCTKPESVEDFHRGLFRLYGEYQNSQLERFSKV